MPYSITTKDGITLNNIPDDVPADAPELKARVAAVRGQRSPAGPSSPAGVTPEGVPRFSLSGMAEPEKPQQLTPQPVTAPKVGYVMGLRDPVDALAQIAENIVPDSVATKVNQFNNWLADKGVPLAKVEESSHGTTKLVQAVNQAYDAQRKQSAKSVGGIVTGEQADPGFDWGRMAGNVINPVTIIGTPSMVGANTLGQLAVRGAVAGAVGGSLQPVTAPDASENFWQKKAGQAAVGAATGAVATPAISRAAEAVARGASALRGALQNRPHVNVDVAVNNVLSQPGIAPADITDEIRNGVRRNIEAALASGQRLDPAAILRRAQFEAVGLTGDAAPTVGQLTRDPIQYAQERNLSGVVLNTPQGQGNPLADRFQAQTQRLKDVFDQNGARQATDRVTAGQSIMDSLRQADEPVRAAVDGAYQNARSMTGGRAVELNRGAFSQAANEALDQGMWGRFVPDNVRGLLNDITEGKAPFTVDAAEQVDGILSAAQRKAGRGSPEWSAIGQIRTALQNTPFAESAPAAQAAAGATRAAGQPVDNGVTNAAFREINPAMLPGQKALPAPGSRALAPDMVFDMPPPQGPSTALGRVRAPTGSPVDEGAAAREAFRQARAAARNRFATIEDTPALAAALDNEAPDKFVQRYVLGANVRDVQAMRNVLSNSPEALAQARAQIADHLKRAAFGGDASGDAAFRPERYQETLRAIGVQKLQTFFTPQEIVRMNLAAKVASDIQSVPAGAKNAVNYSGTGAAVMNLLSKLSESPLMRRVPGARALANHVGEIRTEQQINQALSGQLPPQAAELSPEAVRAIQRLLPLSSAAVGSLGGVAGQ